MMVKISRIAALPVAVSLLLLLTVPATATSPQSLSGTYLEIDTESDGQMQNIKLSLGPDRIRLDVAEQMSLVSLGGDDGRMLMIQHEDQQYMELTAEMMQMMRGMMGQMPQQVETDQEDVVPPTFTRTGNTKQVGEWNAYEVRVEHPEQDGETMMWFSQDVDADFRALAEQLVNSLSSILGNPMMQGMSGGRGNASNILDQIRSQMSSVDVPDGFPVQVVSDAGGDPSITTLKAIDQSASFGMETWEAPAGYTKMEMPFIRR